MLTRHEGIFYKYSRFIIYIVISCSYKEKGQWICHKTKTDHTRLKPCRRKEKDLRKATDHDRKKNYEHCERGSCTDYMRKKFAFIIVDRNCLVQEKKIYV